MSSQPFGNVRPLPRRVIGEDADAVGYSTELATPVAHPLDQDEARAEFRRLLEWWYYERDRQAANRLEMALDADYYDGLQWDPEDAAVLRDRGQQPLVYNEIAPMVDWLIGTERRSRVDWRVLPRAEDDVDLADIKTKVLKYVSDVNRCTFVRSRAFADAIKVGVGWVDDGVRDDPTADPVFSRYESWRNILWDSAAYEPDLADARYIFRWRWVDEDIALAMFPDRADKIREAAEDAPFHRAGDELDEDAWQTPYDVGADTRRGTIHASGTGASIDAKRRRVRLIECQYRKPVVARFVGDGPLRGALFDARDAVLADTVARQRATIIDRITMRVHCAVFVEAALLALVPSAYRHNRFSLTPIWCYRRSRDRLPYGVVRRVRDVQNDLNKRASKALFLLNTNQIIADEGATDDWNNLRDEADRPDGVLVKKPGKELLLRRDSEAANGQLQMMALSATAIQKSAGVSDENLGRQTNAVSGEAIKARQLQGSVVTTEPFDNLRLATQEQGAKQLSLVEQFYTDEKVIRLVGARGAIEWVTVNQPEVQPDGQVRWLNDLTQSMADFVVSEQDYAGTLRQVMFESLNQLATRLPPEVSLRLLTIAMDFSDLPNRDEIVQQIRKITGDRDDQEPETPEEAQALQQQQAMQAEAIEMQREQARTALAEQQAKVREINARAAKLEVEAAALASGGAGAAAGVDAANVRQQAAAEIERVSEALRKAQSELANRTTQIAREADVRLEVARIDADAKLRVAEIQAASDRAIAQMRSRLESAEARLAQGEQGAVTSVQE